jgi:hypothetical protein
MLHSGYCVDGDPNGELRLYRPDGTYLASTYPSRFGAACARHLPF